MNPESLENEDYCYLTTTGRITGRPHEIEIWFALEGSTLEGSTLEGSTLEGSTLYMLSGGGDRSDWVKNIRRSPDTTVRIGNSTFEGRGRLVDEPEEDDLARALLFEKYQPRTGGDLTRWRGYALPVAVDLVGPARDGYNR